MRKKQAEKRRINPDPQYNDLIVAKFINIIMDDGKKSTASRLVYKAFAEVGEKTGKDPLEIFREALTNVAPMLEVKSRRVGGATYQVPQEVREDRRVALALRWIKSFSNGRREKSMSSKLANEIIAASKGEGASVKRKEDMHRMAEANKAFAHFRW
ncbi:30S ribosomal protein S7 [bacterium]|nr:MAG: 30S ribosomal protein S7 [bacterium]